MQITYLSTKQIMNGNDRNNNLFEECSNDFTFL